MTSASVLMVACGSLIDQSGYAVRVLSEIFSLRRCFSNIQINLLVFDEQTALDTRKQEYDKLADSLKKVGVNFICHGTGNFSANLLNKIFSVLDVATIFNKTVRHYKPDIIHLQAHGAAFRLLHARLMTKAKIILDVHGDTFEERIYGRETRTLSMSDRVIFLLDRLTVRASHGVVFVSAAMSQHYKQQSRTALTTVVPCCVDLSRFTPSKNREELREALNVQSRYVVVYSGSFFQKWQEPSDVAAVFLQIKQMLPHAFLLVMTGDSQKRVTDFLHESGLTDEDFLVRKFLHHDVYQGLSCADVGLLLRRPSLVNKVASPTKFGEYIACGVPVIISEGVGDYTDWVEREDIGVVASWRDGKWALPVTNNELLAITKPECRIKCVDIAHQKLDWDHNANHIKTLYEKVLSSTRKHL